MLTQAQLVTLKAAVVANPTANALFVAGDTPTLTAFVNASTTTDSWRETVPVSDMVAALKFATYDSVAGGKRDAFRLMLDFGPVDATRAAIRKGIEDIFTVTGGYTDSTQMGAMLTACTEKATWAQVALGSTTPAAIGGVTAIKRNYAELVTQDEISRLAGV